MVKRNTVILRSNIAIRALSRASSAACGAAHASLTILSACLRTSSLSNTDSPYSICIVPGFPDCLCRRRYSHSYARAVCAQTASDRSGFENMISGSCSHASASLQLTPLQEQQPPQHRAKSTLAIPPSPRIYELALELTIRQMCDFGIREGLCNLRLIGT